MDVFILAGQSNMSGRGGVAQDEHGQSRFVSHEGLSNAHYSGSAALMPYFSPLLGGKSPSSTQVEHMPRLCLQADFYFMTRRTHGRRQ